MQYEDILYENRNGVAWITINRADKMNAFRGTTCDEIIKALNKAGYEVIGVSPDNQAKMAKFQVAHKLKFALLADEDLAVHKKYGAYGTKSMYGRTYEGVLRSTFVVDEKGKLELALYNVKATGHVDSLRKQLGI